MCRASSDVIWVRRQVICGSEKSQIHRDAKEWEQPIDSSSNLQQDHNQPARLYNEERLSASPLGARCFQNDAIISAEPAYPVHASNITRPRSRRIFAMSHFAFAQLPKLTQSEPPFSFSTDKITAGLRHPYDRPPPPSPQTLLPARLAESHLRCIPFTVPVLLSPPESHSRQQSSN